MPVSAKAGDKIYVDFGLKFADPLVLFPGKFKPDSNTVSPHADLHLAVTSTADLQLEAGEIVLYALPLQIGEFDLEEA